MEIVITDWALQSYLNLQNVFTKDEYQKILRPDAELLKNILGNQNLKIINFGGLAKTRAERLSVMDIK